MEYFSLVIIIDDILPYSVINILKDHKNSKLETISVYTTLKSGISNDFNFIKYIRQEDIILKMNIMYNANAIIFISEDWELFMELAAFRSLILLPRDNNIFDKLHSGNEVMVFGGELQLDMILSSLKNNNRIKSEFGIKLNQFLQKMKPITNKVSPIITPENIDLTIQENYLRDKVVWVDPQDIIFNQSPEFNIYFYSGKIIDGNWDLNLGKFEDSVSFYTSYKQRLDSGNWENTKYYQECLKQILSGKILWSCRNKAQWDERCRKIDEVYNSMKNEGYLESKSPDYISINIGRNGELIFNNGRHRLTFAKLLKLDKIPVKITVRHREWGNLRKRIYDYANLNKGKRIYTELKHPDLQDFPVLHLNRFAIIKPHIPEATKTVLDIGTHWGYLAFEFAEVGKECYAVEHDKAYYYYLDKLNAASKYKINVVKQSIFSYIETNNKFDTVLAFAVFHHFLKKEVLFYKFIKMLNSLNMNNMFFQPHDYTEPQMLGAFRNFNNKEFCQFIIDNSCLNNYKLIGEYQNRPIFYLSR